MGKREMTMGGSEGGREAEEERGWKWVVGRVNRRVGGGVAGREGRVEKRTGTRRRRGLWVRGDGTAKERGTGGDETEVLRRGAGPQLRPPKKSVGRPSENSPDGLAPKNSHPPPSSPSHHSGALPRRGLPPPAKPQCMEGEWVQGGAPGVRLSAWAALWVDGWGRWVGFPAAQSPTRPVTGRARVSPGHSALAGIEGGESSGLGREKG